MLIFNMKKQENNNYLSPHVEIVEIDVENGFAQSNGSNTPYWEEGFDI
jgi:hypothetical protein